MPNKIEYGIEILAEQAASKLKELIPLASALDASMRDANKAIVSVNKSLRVSQDVFDTWTKSANKAMSSVNKGGIESIENKLKDVVKATQEATSGLNDVASSLKKVGSEAKSIESASKPIVKVAEATGNAHRKTEDWNAELKKAIEFAGRMTLAVMGITQISDFFSDSIKNSIQLRKAVLGLQTTLTAFGQGQGKVNEYIQALTDDGLVSIASAAATLKNLITIGYSLDDAFKMSQALKQMGAFNAVINDLGQAMEDFSLGLKVNSFRRMDNIGATKTLESIMKDENVTMAEGINLRTNAAQRQAILNSILKDGARFEYDLEALKKDEIGTTMRLEQEYFQLSATIGDELLPAKNELFKVTLELIKYEKELWGLYKSIATFPFPKTDQWEEQKKQKEEELTAWKSMDDYAMIVKRKHISELKGDYGALKSLYDDMQEYVKRNPQYADYTKAAIPELHKYMAQFQAEYEAKAKRNQDYIEEDKKQEKERELAGKKRMKKEAEAAKKNAEDVKKQKQKAEKELNAILLELQYDNATERLKIEKNYEKEKKRIDEQAFIAYGKRYEKQKEYKVALAELDKKKEKEISDYKGKIQKEEDEKIRKREEEKEGWERKERAKALAREHKQDEEREKREKERRVAEKQRQDKIRDYVDSSLQTIILSSQSASEKAMQIWENFLNAVVSAFTKKMAEALIETAIFKTVLNFLTGGFEGISAGILGFLGLSEGGLISGKGTSTSDSIPAMLSTGESVINAKSTQAYKPLLSAINQAGGGVAFDTTPRLSFAGGGMASSITIDNSALLKELRELKFEMRRGRVELSGVSETGLYMATERGKRKANIF